MTSLLALDISSKAIGWCYYDGAVRDRGVAYLQHADINHRCRLARAYVAGLIALHPSLDAVAIESPASPHKGALIPQCLVSGAIRSYVAELDIAICDIPPQHAKQALAKQGNAAKDAMLTEAAQHLGYGDVTAMRRGGCWYAYSGGVEVYSEHVADAVGVALAASKLVIVERAA